MTDLLGLKFTWSADELSGFMQIRFVEVEAFEKKAIQEQGAQKNRSKKKHGYFHN